jgi:hypothetical protein
LAGGGGAAPATLLKVAAKPIATTAKVTKRAFRRILFIFFPLRVWASLGVSQTSGDRPSLRHAHRRPLKPTGNCCQCNYK